jgi:oligoribonuclease (3'-5' exoribonuclease)
MTYSTDTPHLPTPSHLLELSTPNIPKKGGKSVEELFNQLPPYGKPKCVTHFRDDETIDEAISRITTLEDMYKMYWMLAQKAQNADQGKNHKKTLPQKGRAAVDKALHLLATELNLERGSLAHMMANTAAERRIWAAMQYDVHTKILKKISISPTSQQTQDRESKEYVNKEVSESTSTCAGFSDEDRSTLDDGMPKLTSIEQLQRMQDKAEAISNLQRELQNNIQAYKLSHLQDDDVSSGVSNTGTKNKAMSLLAVPDQAIKKDNKGTKRQVGDAESWGQVPPGPGVPHTLMTKRGKCRHWCPHHHKWTQHPPRRVQIPSSPIWGSRGGTEWGAKEEFLTGRASMVEC